MFANAIRLPFRLFGIPVQLDISFLIFLPVLAWMIGSNLDALVEMLALEIETAELIDGTRPFLVGMAAALGLFLSVLVHEVGHCLVALRYGIKAKSITLWLLGGMAQFEEMPRQAGREAVIAIAGPITSYALGGIFWIILQLVEQPFGVFLFSYLFFMNWLLATFNLVPALPLDGGRVLRSLLDLWLPHVRATQVAAGVSKVLALLMGLAGFLSFNILLILIAFFVYAAGRSESTFATIRESLQGLLVSDLMSRDVDTVPSHTFASDLLEKMLHDRYLGFPVIDLEGKLVGMVSLEDIKKRGPLGISKDLRVSDLMQSPAPILRENEGATDAFERITKEGVDRLAVVDENHRLVGIISNTDLVRAVQVRMTEAAVHNRWRMAS